MFLRAVDVVTLLLGVFNLAMTMGSDSKSDHIMGLGLTVLLVLVNLSLHYIAAGKRK